MSVKEMVLFDLPDLYPGLSRAGVEHVLSTLDAPPVGGGTAMASELVVLAPVIAARLKSLTGDELDGYVDMMKSASVLVLQMWTSNGRAPLPAAIISGVEALDAPMG